MKEKEGKKSFFFNISKFDFETFFKLIPKNCVIVDYGCGTGIWAKKNINHFKVKKIKLFDYNNLSLPILKKKYLRYKKISILDNLDLNGSVLLLNSVIQYINKQKFDILTKKIFSKKSNFKIIIISDIPKFPRFIEAIIMLIINPKRLMIGIKYLLNKNYINLGFYQKNLNEVVKNRQNFDFHKFKNLNDEKYLRYSLIFKSKKLSKKNHKF